MCYHLLKGLRGTVPSDHSLGDVEDMIHTPTYTLAAHMMVATPQPPKPPTQTEQFIDAPPKDMYVNDWREHVKRKQKQEVNKPHVK